MALLCCTVLASTAVVADEPEWDSNLITSERQQTVRLNVRGNPEVLTGQRRHQFQNTVLIVQCARVKTRNDQFRFYKSLEVWIPYDDVSIDLLNQYFREDLTMQVHAVGSRRSGPPMLAHILPDISGLKRMVLFNIMQPFHTQSAEAFREKALAQGSTNAQIERHIQRQNAKAVADFDNMISAIESANSTIDIDVTLAGSDKHIASFSFTANRASNAIGKYYDYCTTPTNMVSAEEIRNIDLGRYQVDM